MVEGLVKCFNCGRERVDSFGKVVDGSWVMGCQRVVYCMGLMCVWMRRKR
jgi:hypothetical protein